MKDLTKGNPFRLILLFTLPVLAGNVFQQLYNMVDTIIVGNTVNAAAFTGVGLTGPLTFLILGFVNGLTSGFSVCISQRFGAGDKAGVRRAVGLSFLLCVGMTVVVTAVAVPLTAPLLRIMATPEQYYDYAYCYLFTIFCGIGATVFYNMTAGILRAIGDSRTPLLFLMVAVVVNIGLDFTLIVGFRMHYIGAALATVISQFIAGLASLVYMLRRYPFLRLKREDWKWDWALAGKHIAVGLPMALQFSITAIGCIVQQTALNGLDAALPGAVTAYTAASKIDNLASQIFASLGVAMATYVGQNYGAGRYDRIRRGVSAGMAYVMVGAVVGIAFCLGLCEPLMKLFLNTDRGGVNFNYSDVITYGREYLFFQSVSYGFLGTIFIYRNTLQGAGRSLLAMFAGVTELAGRVAVSLILVKRLAFTGVCLSNPAAWIAADVFLVTSYCIVMHQAGSHEGSGTVRRKWFAKSCPSSTLKLS
jgi:putative MATE family efflux protein